MDSLADVVAFLRNDNRQDLAALLAGAQVDFEYIDTVFSITSAETEFHLVNAAIFAPMVAYRQLRELPKEDEEVILNALREVWPASAAGGEMIHTVSYNVDKDSLRDDLTLLFESPIGWQDVDRTVGRIRELLTIASNVDHFKEIGVLCREALISVAQTVFDSRRHPPLSNDDIGVSETDTKRMIGRYLASEYPGRSNKAIRKCVDSAVDLANKVTHRQASEYRDALLCAQATFSVIGLIAIVSGKGDRDELDSSAK